VNHLQTSLLLGDKIISSQITWCGCYSSRYGFVENADFAEKAEQNNIILLGLNQAIHIMGSKLAAKEAVKAYNIPWFLV
jgi:propionyl-CoA carboxylase alpha chain